MKQVAIYYRIKRYAVLISLLISVIFVVKASWLYPGGSLTNPHSVGFHWSHNFISNLFQPKAINGAANPGQLWAALGMAFHSFGYGLFFVHMSKKITARPWAQILKYIGVANFILVFLIATPLHDLGVLSIAFTLMGFFTITVFILKSRLHVLKVGCILCLLSYYCFFIFYGLGYLSITAILQKVYIVSSMLLVLGLEYFSQHEHFANLKWGKQKKELHTTA